MKQLSLIWVFRLWTLQTLPMNMLDTLFLSFQTEGGIKDPPRDLLVNILREVELQYAKVSLFLYQLAWKNIWQEEKQLAQMQWFSFLSVTIRREAAHIKGRTFMMCPCDSVNKSFVAVCAGEEGEEWQNIVLSSTCVWKGWRKGLGYEHRAVRNKLNLFFTALFAQFRLALVPWTIPELDFFIFEVDLARQWQCTMSVIPTLCVSQNTTAL